MEAVLSKVRQFTCREKRKLRPMEHTERHSGRKEYVEICLHSMSCWFNILVVSRMNSWISLMATGFKVSTHIEKHNKERVQQYFCYGMDSDLLEHTQCVELYRATHSEKTARGNRS